MTCFFYYLGVVEFENGALVGGRPDEHPGSKQTAEANASTAAATEEESRSVEERIIDQVPIKFFICFLASSNRI